MEEQILLERFIEQMKMPVLDDLIPNESVFVKSSEIQKDCVLITSRFSVQDE